MNRTRCGPVDQLIDHLHAKRLVYGRLALAIAIFVAGTLTASYWPAIRCFWRTHSVGEFIHEAAPGISAVVAITVFWWQASRARYNMGIDLILKLADRFDSPPMREVRARAARQLLSKAEGMSPAIDDLLDFLEQIGFLLSRRAIDIDAVYEFFETWAVPYSQETDLYRRWARVRDNAPDLYVKVDWLFGALEARERRTTGESARRTPEQIEHFLKGESDLSVQD